MMAIADEVQSIWVTAPWRRRRRKERDREGGDRETGREEGERETGRDERRGEREKKGVRKG